MLVAAHTTLPTFPDAPAAVRRARAHQPRLQYSHPHSAQRVHQQFAEALSASPALVIPDGHPILASPSAPLREKLIAAQVRVLLDIERIDNERLILRSDIPVWSAACAPRVATPPKRAQPFEIRRKR